ncbi:MAG: hypothetical protein LQ338_000463 [Usnochroma carphineum]|nr:MAG: hypothetical protein LQ338_000463 [Usnochroma carphineum]
MSLPPNVVYGQAPNAFAAPGPRGPYLRSRKRLIACCDGTWLNSNMGLMNKKLPIPSNVTRIMHATKAKTSDGVPQIVFYEPGIGSEGNILNRIVGGATAQGLSENIRETYAFLANNYSNGDEIFLIGFSRGAFTARSVAGFIGGVGLLTKSGLPNLAEVFKDFQHRRDPNYRPAKPNVPFPRKPSANDPRYREKMAQEGLTRLGIRIKVVGVFDTVGSLGIPRVGWLERTGLQRTDTKEFLFYDTNLDNSIENAYQALALDENRTAFSPAVWEKPPGNTTNLRQVWFPGTHSNIGGGYPDQGMANITLAWMMSQLDPFIDFDPEYILDCYDDTKMHYKETDQKPRPWSFGKIYNSLTGIYLLDGSTTRTPGMYFRMDPNTGRATSKPLRQTNEYIHPSARTRLELDGPGKDDRGPYEGKALDPYRLRYEDDPANGTRPRAMWVSRSKRKGAPRHQLPESPLWDKERQLLRESPKMYDYVLGVG